METSFLFYIETTECPDKCPDTLKDEVYVRDVVVGTLCPSCGAKMRNCAAEEAAWIAEDWDRHAEEDNRQSEPIELIVCPECGACAILDLD